MMRPPITTGVCPECRGAPTTLCGACGLCGSHLHDHGDDAPSVHNPGGSADLRRAYVLVWGDPWFVPPHPRPIP